MVVYARQDSIVLSLFIIYSGIDVGDRTDRG